ncbi:MAG: hypothetical protein ACLSA6_16480 [Holdemania massiliensis]
MAASFGGCAMIFVVVENYSGTIWGTYSRHDRVYGRLSDHDDLDVAWGKRNLISAIKLNHFESETQGIAESAFPVFL